MKNTGSKLVPVKSEDQDRELIFRRGVHGGLPFTIPPSIFLHHLNAISETEVILGNGLFDILAFFTTHPPHGFVKKFVVTKDMIPFIPSEWQEDFLYYEYTSSQETKFTTNCLILDFYEDVSSIDLIDRYMKIFKEKAKGNKNYIYVNYLSRPNDLSLGRFRSNSSDFFSYLTHKLGNIEFISSDFFETQHNLGHINFSFIKERIEVGASQLEARILNLSGNIEELDSKTRGQIVKSYITSPHQKLELKKFTPERTVNEFNMKALIQNLALLAQRPSPYFDINNRQLLLKIIKDHLD